MREILWIFCFSKKWFVSLIKLVDMEKTLEDRVAEYVEGVKSINPEVTWDLLHTAVLFGYHMGVEDEQNRPCKGVN